MLCFLLLATLLCVAAKERPCAYWCESSCTAKIPNFYCCSYEPSLTGLKGILQPPCPNLCSNRTGNDVAHNRNCRIEMENLKIAGVYSPCKSLRDCDTAIYDLCCPDNCLPASVKICVKL